MRIAFNFDCKLGRLLAYWTFCGTSTTEVVMVASCGMQVGFTRAQQSCGRCERTRDSGKSREGVRGHLFLTPSIMFCCHTSLSDVGPASHTALQPRSTPRIPWTLLRYVALTYISCSYVPRSHLCLTADLVAWYCIVGVYTHHLS